MNELNPCPFCHSDDVEMIGPTFDDRDFVECNDCGAQAQLRYWNADTPSKEGK